MAWREQKVECEGQVFYVTFEQTGYMFRTEKEKDDPLAGRLIPADIVRRLVIKKEIKEA